MSNHYHFIAYAPGNALTLSKMIQAIHSISARLVNLEDGLEGRKVWFQYRDTCITNEKSYLSRLNYVHNNPVKHGLVKDSINYPWCSMKWFLNSDNDCFCRKVLSFKHDIIPDVF